MEKLDEYLQHAAECREMARTAKPEQRQMLENMAATWERLAVVRRGQIKKPDESEDWK